MIPRIKEILHVELYKIVCAWNTNEIRAIDFIKWKSEKESQSLSTLTKLFQPEIFMTAKLDVEQQNIIWPNLVPMKNLNGEVEMVALDFSPEVLYNMSIKI